MPITIKYFLFLTGSGRFRSSDIGDPVTIESCKALAASNSISKFEIVLSNVLHPIVSEPVKMAVYAFMKQKEVRKG